jgi:hypothetical protein
MQHFNSVSGRLYVTNIRLLWKCAFRIQRHSFITTLFLCPFDDVITKFYCNVTESFKVQCEWSNPISRRLITENPAHMWQYKLITTLDQMEGLYDGLTTATTTDTDLDILVWKFTERYQHLSYCDNKT